MKNKNMLKLALLPLLAITIAGCGDNTSNSDKPVGPSTPSGEGPTEEVSSSYEDKMSWSQISEELKLIPQEVLTLFILLLIFSPLIYKLIKKYMHQTELNKKKEEL